MLCCRRKQFFEKMIQRGNRMTDFNRYTERRGTSCMKYDGAALMNQKEGLLPLWVADMDFPVPDPVTEALQRKTEHSIYGYGLLEDSYFEAATGWFRKHFDTEYKKEWMLQTPGVVFAICQAVRAFTEPGDAVLINRPVYYPFTSSIENNGRRAVNSPLVNHDGNWSMDFEDFEKKIIGNDIKLYILCSPHNPVGRVWTEKELNTVVSICKKHDVLIVSDEIHCDFTWQGHPFTPLHKIASEQDVKYVICTAPSKTFNLAGLQASNIIIPDPEIRRIFRKELTATGCFGINVMGAAACEAAYRHGQDWLNGLRSYIKENIDFTARFLEKHLPQIHFNKPEGTYLLWFDMSSLGMTAKELDDFITEKAGLWLDGGSMFGPEGDGFQRLNAACHRSTLEQALQQLKEAVDKL